MKIEQKISVHNRFDIEVRDKESGEVKQTAVGFNVITNNYFRYMLNMTQVTDHTPLGSIVFGDGTGTPAETDTALFNQIDVKSATTVETVYAYPTSHITKRIILEADSYNGKNITEVGFRGYFFISSGGNYLMSHAMLQDSEGRQIAIHKTDTDVVYINATFYCTYTPSGFGNNGIYPLPSKNDLIKWIFGEYIVDYTDQETFRYWHHPLQYSSDLGKYYSFTKSYRIYSYSSTKGIGKGDYDAKTLTIEAATILSTEGNGQSVRVVGFPNFGAFCFPDSSVMERYAIQNKTIGNGDGSTTDFKLGAPFIRRNSVHIYIDDVEKTEGTDYTINYDSNETDNCGNYHSAKLSLLNDREHVVWGNEASRSRASSTYYDPICMSVSLGGGDTLPSSCSVTESQPIWVDFSEAKNCNRLKFTKAMVTSGKEDALAIEYSNDNENWTRVSYVRTDRIYTFEDVSARYWRVFIPNTTWSYSFNGSSTVDGTANVGAAFYLGETHPSLHFTTPPATGSVITASYDLEVPYKTENNIIRITIVVSLNRD